MTRDIPIHYITRNAAKSMICLIRYNSMRSKYRLGRITNVYEGSDGLVRRVTLEYKRPNEKKFRTVDRAIHRIAVIVPGEQ